MPPTTGGVESHVADLALTLAELGCLVTVLTGEPVPAPVAGVEVIHVPHLHLEGPGRHSCPANDLEKPLTQVFGELISSRGLEVVHGHNLHHFLAAPALALDELRRQHGFRLHHTFHEAWPDVLRDRPVYRDWDGNYAVSRFIQSECVRQIGFRPDLRPLGVNTERFRSRRPAWTGGGIFTILHPARVLPWKGIHVSVDMLVQLRRRGVGARLLVTDTPRIIDWDQELVAYRNDISARLHSERIAHMVDFRSVAYCDMPKLYDEADVVVYPTVGDEPFGLVPLEAMSMARPVVGSRSGGIVETIVENETGFLVERGQAMPLADCVERLFRDRELCRRMGQAGRRHVRANFNGRGYAERLLEQYLSARRVEPPEHTDTPGEGLQNGVLR